MGCRAVWGRYTLGAGSQLGYVPSPLSPCHLLELVNKSCCWVRNGQCQASNKYAAVSGDVIVLTKGDRSPWGCAGVGAGGSGALPVSHNLGARHWALVFQSTCGDPAPCGARLAQGGGCWGRRGIWEAPKRQEMSLYRGVLRGAAGGDMGPGTLGAAGDVVAMPGTFPIPMAALFWGFQALAPSMEVDLDSGCIPVAPSRQECAGSSSLPCQPCLASLAPLARRQCHLRGAGDRLSGCVSPPPAPSDALGVHPAPHSQGRFILLPFSPA